VFEDWDDAPMRKRVLLERSQGPGYRWTNSFEVRLLDEGDRRRLAMYINHPESSGYSTVGAIRMGDPATSPGLRRLFDEYRIAHPAGAEDPLRVLYLLSITAGTGGNPGLPEKLLLSDVIDQGAVRFGVLR